MAVLRCLLVAGLATSLLAACTGREDVGSGVALILPSGCVVTDWGPREVHAGERFNEQPDGYSALWFGTGCLPEGTMLAFDGQLVEISRGPQEATASFNADGVLAKPGSHRVALREAGTKREIPLGTLRVLPARGPAQLPAPLPRHWPAEAPALPPPVLVAHAGGAWQGRTYCNCLEALSGNYALGHRLFELDFGFTSDRQLVAIHDWGSSWRRLFPDAPAGSVPDHATFMQARMRDGFTQLDLPRLRAWLEAHPDAFIVTDIHGGNLRGLQLLKAALGTAQRRVIPQLYHPHTYADIRALGYEQIIFTLYGTSLDTDDLLAFIRATPLYGVTVDPTRRDAARILRELVAAGVPVWVHTFNEPEELARFRAEGIHGVYSDRLHPLPGGGVGRQPPS